MLNGVSLPDGLSLRAAEGKDRPFLERLFRATREWLQLLPLPQPQIDALSDQQYRLQQIGYAGRWPDARTLIIERSGRPIGKIMLDESETALRVIEIALGPGARRRGHGTAVLRALQAAAAERRLPMALSVNRQNAAAKKLYLTLGFEVTGASDTDESMRWTPPVPGAAAVSRPPRCEVFAARGGKAFMCSTPPTAMNERSTHG